MGRPAGVKNSKPRKMNKSGSLVKSKRDPQETRRDSDARWRASLARTLEVIEAFAMGNVEQNPKRSRQVVLKSSMDHYNEVEDVIRARAERLGLSKGLMSAWVRNNFALCETSQPIIDRNEETMEALEIASSQSTSQSSQATVCGNFNGSVSDHVFVVPIYEAISNDKIDFGEASAQSEKVHVPTVAEILDFESNGALISTTMATSEKELSDLFDDEGSEMPLKIDSGGGDWFPTPALMDEDVTWTQVSEMNYDSIALQASPLAYDPMWEQIEDDSRDYVCL